MEVLQRSGFRVQGNMRVIKGVYRTSIGVIKGI